LDELVLEHPPSHSYQIQLVQKTSGCAIDRFTEDIENP